VFVGFPLFKQKVCYPAGPVASLIEELMNWQQTQGQDSSKPIIVEPFDHQDQLSRYFCVLKENLYKQVENTCKSGKNQENKQYPHHI